MKNPEGLRTDLPGLPGSEQFSVNFVTVEARRAEKVRFHAARTEDFNIDITDKPDFSVLYDAYILPVKRLLQIDAAQALRLTGTPLIAYGASEDLGAAFLFGCRDYLKNPWNFDELYFRLMKIRSSGKIPFQWGYLQLERMGAASEYGHVQFTFRESLIMKVLAKSRGRPVPREVLESILGRKNGSAVSRAIDMQVSHLRGKLQRITPKGVNLIVSVRCKGYMLADDTKHEQTCG